MPSHPITIWDCRRIANFTIFEKNFGLIKPESFQNFVKNRIRRHAQYV